MKISRALLVALFFCLAMQGCIQSGKDVTPEVLGTVKRYNGLLRRAYLEANISLLGPVATQNQIDKVYPVIQALRSQNSSMIAEQKSFGVLQVQAESGTAMVRTEEQWEYWWQDKDTGVITKDKAEVNYRIAYRLVHEGRSWKVDSIEAVPD